MIQFEKQNKKKHKTLEETMNLKENAIVAELVKTPERSHLPREQRLRNMKLMRD